MLPIDGEDVMKSFPILLLVFLLSGCAMGKFGHAAIPGQPLMVGQGMSIEEVIAQLGVPDRHVQLGNVDYLGYDGKKGWWANFVIFGLNFGHTEAGSLELRFENNKLVSQHYADKGDSTGIYMPQSGVSE